MRVRGPKQETIIMDGLTVDGWVESATVFKRRDGKSIAVLVLDRPTWAYHDKESI